MLFPGISTSNKSVVSVSKETQKIFGGRIKNNDNKNSFKWF